MQIDRKLREDLDTGGKGKGHQDRQHRVQEQQVPQDISLLTRPQVLPEPRAALTQAGKWVQPPPSR